MNIKVENGLIRHSICDCGGQIYQDVETGRRSCEGCPSYWEPDDDSLMEFGNTWVKASIVKEMFDSLISPEHKEKMRLCRERIISRLS